MRARRYIVSGRNGKAAEELSAGQSAEAFLQEYQNYSETENGAIGYRSANQALVNLNFMVSSLRNREEADIVRMFIQAYYETPEYAVKWLFFARDIQEGLGERRTFRVCLKYLAESHPAVAGAILPLIPQYGRFDDLLVFLDTSLCHKTGEFIRRQLQKDLQAMEEGKPISLLGKWLPSINTSSKESVRLARKLLGELHMSEKEYRKTLSKLRAYSKVTEVAMTARDWQEIDYEKVPAKAGMKYEKAFDRHDKVRYEGFLREVALGDKKLNSNGLVPYDIVRKIIGDSYYGMGLKDNALAEVLWQILRERGYQSDFGLENAIVVSDGSGSMYSMLGDYSCNGKSCSEVRPIDVAVSLAIYFAEQLQGVFHDKAITFSSRPQFIDLSKGHTLKQKVEIMMSHNEISNTNIEAVFDMLLALAQSEQVPQEQMPKQVLIISDMEFDAASTPNSYRDAGRPFSATLFGEIRQKWEAAGYQLPKLIFWNVNSRTGTIPMTTNEAGVALISGVSQNAMKVAAVKEKRDPFESLTSILDGERYRPVTMALRRAS